MVKLTGPALGQQASGSLAGALIYSNSRGRSYLKKSAKPTQPRTKPQMAMRAAMQFLSQQWPNLTFFDRQTWEVLADQTGVSTFNAYQGENLTRIRNYLAPTIQYPAAETGAVAGINYFNATGHTRRLTIEWNITSVNQGWGFKIFHVSGNGITPVWSDLIGIFPSLIPGTNFWTWQQNTPGLYWICYTRFTYFGYLHPTAISWDSATVLA